LGHSDIYLRYVIGINLIGAACSLRTQNRKEQVVKVNRQPCWLHFSDNCYTSKQAILETGEGSVEHALRDIAVKKMLTHANLNKLL
jgi:hypothetical protein